MESPRSPRAAGRSLSLSLMLAIGVACVTGVSAARELYRRERVEAELQTLEDRVEKLQDRKLAVLRTLELLQTPDVIDREARLRLNMQKPGERVYILRGEGWEEQARGEAVASTGSDGLPPESSPRTNLQRWFRYFFIHSNS